MWLCNHGYFLLWYIWMEIQGITNCGICGFVTRVISCCGNIWMGRQGITCCGIYRWKTRIVSAVVYVDGKLGYYQLWYMWLCNQSYYLLWYVDGKPGQYLLWCMWMGSQGITNCGICGCVTRVITCCGMWMGNQDITWRCICGYVTTGNTCCGVCGWEARVCDISYIIGRRTTTTRYCKYTTNTKT